MPSALLQRNLIWTSSEPGNSQKEAFSTLFTWLQQFQKHTSWSHKQTPLCNMDWIYVSHQNTVNESYKNMPHDKHATVPRKLKQVPGSPSGLMCNATKLHETGVGACPCRLYRTFICASEDWAIASKNIAKFFCKAHNGQCGLPDKCIKF